MRITEQDEKLFMSLYQFEYLDLGFIQKYVYIDMHLTYINKRIKMLTITGYVEAIACWHKSPVSNQNYKQVYTIGVTGYDWLCSTIGEGTQLKPIAKDQATITRMIEIAHMVSRYQQSGRGIIYMNAERAVFQYGLNQRGQIRPAGQLLVPVLFNNQSMYISYWIELERTRGSIENLALNLKRYNQFLHFKAYEKQLIYDRPVFAFRVLSIARDETSMYQQLHRTKDLKLDVPIYFAIKQDVFVNPLGHIYNTFDEKGVDLFGNSKNKGGAII
ncbi:hypothetical protein [Culicoidibacter larvae]|uniref:Uncharacterized protein n=1 Tax=Culicoidibacter larvae TaxID=2579976 RepID=A0A5R8QHC6_9FIRM|nr:hypothetical protein [Culicoidibacter larvae]TLG77352.1 hypothetical protein FEZ08_01665 [Culicoidibacter larvae]